MNISIEKGETVRDVVVKYPETRKVLESYGVDYCCGGGKTLEDAAADDVFRIACRN